MQLTELLYQRVKELGAQGQFALRPGYVAIVSRASAVRAALVAALVPGPDDQRKLEDGAAGAGGPARIGLGLLGGDGKPYRLLREVGGSRQLQRFDPATKKFITLTEDSLEIDSFLRVECGLPPGDGYVTFFVLESNELPSLRAKALGAAGEAQVDQVRVKALREELENTRNFETLQDRLFRVQQRLHELSELDHRLRDAEQEYQVVEDEAQRSPWTAEQIKDISKRAAGAKELQKRREEVLGDLIQKRQRALDSTPETPLPFLKDPWFGGGLAAGVAIDILAVALKTPALALLGVAPYAASLVSVLRWIQGDEEEKEAATYLQDIGAREKQARRTFEEEAAPLKNALKAANAGSAEELVELFKQREEVLARRDLLKAKYDELLKDPELSQVAAELPPLEAERRQLEQDVAAQGFARAVGEIERDLKSALGLTEAAKKPGSSQAASEGETPRLLVERAGDLLGISAEELWTQLGPRLSTYLAALTDKRVASARPDAKGGLILVAADGRQGPYLGMPPPLRDLCYSALRLALVEKVVAVKPLPLVVDDSFAPLDPAKRQLVAKMLKGISAQTQVIHRSVEPPPPGTADHVVQS